jgi:hypothetical protein
VGTPAVSDLTLAPGAGHGDEGDASFQGPAQEQVLPAQPKPTLAEAPGKPEAAISDVAAKSEISKPKQAEIIAVNFETASSVTTGLVTAHPKPAKRLNAKERAKANAKDGIRPDTKAKAKSKAEAKAKRNKDKKDTAASSPA